MAVSARRVSKSAIDWVKALEKASKADKDALRAFKARQDAYVSRVNKYSESLKPIDFAAYKGKVNDPAIIDALEKEYKAVQVPYPKDHQNLDAEIRKVKNEGVNYENFMRAALTRYITVTEGYLKEAEKVPDNEYWNEDMYRMYFPGNMPDPNQKVNSVVTDHACLRIQNTRQPPLWKLPYKAMVDDGVDWLFLRGKYKDEFKNANRHVTDQKEVAAPQEAKPVAA